MVDMPMEGQFAYENEATMGLASCDDIRLSAKLLLYRPSPQAANHLQMSRLPLF